MYQVINIDTVIKRVHPNSITLKDTLNGKIGEYKDLRITYKYLSQKEKLSLRQRIICYLGLLRFLFNPQGNCLNYFLQKFLSFFTKLFTS